jgi:hypothetical protein
MYKDAVENVGMVDKTNASYVKLMPVTGRFVRKIIFV